MVLGVKADVGQDLPHQGQDPRVVGVRLQHTRHLLDEVVVSESGLIRILLHQPVPFYFHLDNTDADTHLILSGSGSKRPLKLQIPANPNSLLIQ